MIVINLGLLSNKKIMLNYLNSALKTCFGLNRSSLENDSVHAFPKRRFYPFLNYIQTDELLNSLKNDKYILIDVREKTSYHESHIISAINFTLTDKSFEESCLDFIEQCDKDLIFYSNGIACSQSYIASSKIMDLLEKYDINKKIYTYDAGINELSYSFSHKRYLAKSN